MLVRLLRTYLRPYRWLLVALAALQLAAVIAGLYLPSLNGRIIDDGIAQGDTGAILRLGGVMLGVSLVQVAATIFATWIAARCSSGLAAAVRRAVFERVGAFSHEEMVRFGAPTLISRSTNDVQQVQMVANLGLSVMVSAPIMMVGGLIMALQEDLGLAWLVAVAVPVLGIVIGTVVTKMLPSFRRMQAAVDTVNRILREQITGVRVVRAFVREDAERERFGAANTDYTDAAVRVGRLFALTFPFAMFVLNLSTVGVIWFGAHRVDSGAMTVGALTAFMQYLMQILMSVIMATMMSMMIPRAAVSSGRIMEVLETAPTLHEAAHPVAVPDGAPTLELDHVTFAYPGADVPVLRDISFTARPGQTTAVIGSTGSGKTTIVNLIPRLQDPTSGVVRVGGVALTQARLEDLWTRVGLVPQKPFLFSGTVASNLRYGKPGATDEELWEALRVAQAADFVREMDGALEATIAQGGANVSGGQRQRLAIARALVKRPDIYVFDDAFSALDLATDARLRAALVPVTRDAVVIVVAQRISSILDADQILVVDDGAIVGRGTHDELLASCPTYVEIVQSQATREEAA